MKCKTFHGLQGNRRRLKYKMNWNKIDAKMIQVYSNLVFKSQFICYHIKEGDFIKVD